MCFFIGKLEEGGEDAIAAGWGLGKQQQQQKQIVQLRVGSQTCP